MIILFLFCYIFSDHTIKATGIDFATKPIICAVVAQKLPVARPETLFPNPDTIPKECEILIFSDCEFSTPPSISCDQNVLKTVVDLNKPVLLNIFRPAEYWSNVSPDAIVAEAKVVTDFVTANRLKGVLISGIPTTEATKNDIFKSNLIPYLTQLKCNPDFVIGVYIMPEYVNGAYDFNFEVSNEFVDFYLLNTFQINKDCTPELSHGVSPIHGTSNFPGVDTVLGFVKDSTIEVNKIYLIIDLLIVDSTGPTFKYSSHDDVCSGKFDACKWCVPTTQDYYDKAKFIRDQNYGVAVYWIALDDFQDTCGCGSYIGLLNIAAGYKGEPPKPCPKFDIMGAP